MIASTERLLITTWTLDDLDDALKLWGDAKVMEFIDTRGGLSKEQVQDKLSHLQKNYLEFRNII